MTKKLDFFDTTPVCNTGVVNTYIVGTNLLIDWLSVTLKLDCFDYYSIINLFTYFFEVEDTDVTSVSGGLYGYTSTFYFKNIKIMLNPEREDMGVHILMSGSGCRDFEDLKLDWFLFFKKIQNYEYSYTRIDIAIDKFDNKYFTISKIFKYFQNLNVRTKFKTLIDINKYKLSDFSNMGSTLDLGSKGSLVQITFYDKLEERKQKNYIVSDDITVWLRTELRFKGIRANELVNIIINNGIENLGHATSEVLLNYIQFIEPTSDTNKARWPISKWWLDFLNTTDKLQLSKINVETSITKKANWLKGQVSKTDFEVFISSIPNLDIVDNITLEYVYSKLSNGRAKINNKSLILINEYRTKNNMSLVDFDVINSFMNTIKEELRNDK